MESGPKQKRVSTKLQKPMRREDRKPKENPNQNQVVEMFKKKKAGIWKM